MCLPGGSIVKGDSSVVVAKVGAAESLAECGVVDEVVIFVFFADVTAFKIGVSPEHMAEPLQHSVPWLANFYCFAVARLKLGVSIGR